MTREGCQSQPCRCAQHRTETFGGPNDAARSYASAREAAEYFVDQHVRFGQPIAGAVTFSGPGSGWEVPPDVYPGMIEHVRRAVDDYVAGLPEVEDDAATVVELIRRGESWHIAISRGKMYHETAEDSLGSAFDAVKRVLGEKVGQSVGGCAEVPTDSGLDKTLRLIDVQQQLIEARKALADLESRSAAAVYLDILQTEPEEGYAP